jgi:ubiquinone/menaquinone biosynthesis C-methylase UbiE
VVDAEGSGKGPPGAEAVGRAAGPAGHEAPEGEGLWKGWDSEFVTSWWVEGFTEGADAEYAEQILPIAAEHLEGARCVLDVGCGEGQVSRLAAALPGMQRVVGVDPTAAQLRVAAARGAGVGYARAGAACLPFPSASFDTVVACLVFEHIDEVDAAIAEVGRVLAPGGRFLFFLNHPLLQTPGSGWIDDHILEEQYWRIGPYLVEDTTLEQVDNGVWIPFIHRPLSRYVNALIGAGMLLTAMLEPAPPPGFLARADEYSEAATIPRLLFLRAEKVRGSAR